MDKKFKLQPSILFIFSLLYSLNFHFAYAQTLTDSIVDQYVQIEKSKGLYSVKVIAIDQLLEAEKSNIDSIQLSLLYNEYSKLNNRNSDYQNAIINAKKALEIQKEFLDSIPKIVNNTYNNLAYFYQYAKDETNAIKTFESLIQQSHKDRFTVSACTTGLAKIFIERGDYYKLLDYLEEQKHSIANQKDTILSKELYRVYICYARVYIKIKKQKNYNTAIDYLKKAETSIQHLSDKSQVRQQILIYNRYAIIYDELKEYNRAIDYYTKALSLSINSKKINKSNVATIYNNLGFIYAKMNDYKTAYDYYQKGLQYDAYRASIFDNLGDYFLYQQDYKQALLHYQKAINYNLEHYDTASFKELPLLEDLMLSTSKIELVNDLTDKANAWKQFYIRTKNKEYLQDALSTITLADQLIDVIRSESDESRSKFFWREKGVDLYMLATSICYILNRPEDAFYFMEKNKSLSLLENLTHEEAKKHGGLPESLQVKEYTLKHNIFLAGQQSFKNEKERQSLIFQKKRVYERFLESLEQEYPNYYNYKKEIELISFEECQQEMINTNSISVQYILTEKEGYGMYISPNTNHFFKIDDVQALHKDIITLRKLFSRPIFSVKNHKHYKELSFRISKQLLPFIINPRSFQNKKMIIVPDHILQYVPFEALIVNPNIKKTADRYLINFIETSYLYSMSLSKRTNNQMRSPSQNLIGFAPVHFKNHNLSDLKISEQKMREIHNLYDGNILTKNSALKSTFVKESHDYKTIHLSTHAGSNNQKPWIAFYDEKLNLDELYFIKNQADLVILDACKTGVGKLLPGEGIMSLTKGFFHSGAKSVVSSMWNTNEKSSNEIIINFYKYLKQGVSKSSALRKAKLEYLQQHQGSEISPYFWGPLILYGDTGSLELTSDSKSVTWIYISIFILLLFSILFIKKMYPFTSKLLSK